MHRSLTADQVAIVTAGGSGMGAGAATARPTSLGKIFASMVALPDQSSDMSTMKQCYGCYFLELSR
ncbi:MAG: hypothetical protein WBA57_13275 [Elainellaceae cyanobacterium]